MAGVIIENVYDELLLYVCMCSAQAQKMDKNNTNHLEPHMSLKEHMNLILLSPSGQHIHVVSTSFAQLK